MIYGSIPAAGKGSRLQPLGFSKELAPIGHKAIIEYLLDRMVSAGIKKIFVSIDHEKTDIIKYLWTKTKYKSYLVFSPKGKNGLQDGILSPAKFLHPEDEIYFGLPDTLWFPENGFKQLIKHNGKLVLGLFDSGSPEKFDSVDIDDRGVIKSVEVKVDNPKSNWTWGIGKVRVSEVAILNKIASKDKTRNILFGNSIHKYSQLHPAHAIQFKNSSFLDIGRKEDYQKASIFLKEHSI